MYSSFIQNNKILIDIPTTDTKAGRAFTCCLNPRQKLKDFYQIYLSQEGRNTTDCPDIHFHFAHLGGADVFIITFSTYNNLSQLFLLRLHVYVNCQVLIKLHLPFLRDKSNV